jgi:hypothetical protein
LGLSAVHFNRVLRQRRGDGLATFRDAIVAFDDYDRQTALIDFDLANLDQTGPLLT